MRRWLPTLLAALPCLAAETSYRDIDAPPHLYRQRTPADRFTRMKDDLESGRMIFSIVGGDPGARSILEMATEPGGSPGASTLKIAGP